jgi:hypothetical protein
VPIEKNEIAREILSYLTDHPDAQDTLEGIVEWWLLESRIKFQREMVKEAIAELVRKELVVESEDANSRLHYRINESTVEEIRTMLEQEQKERPSG